MSFQKELRERRKALGLTQGELAEALNVTLLTVSRWERGDRKPHALMIEGIKVTLERLERERAKKGDG